MHVVIVLLVVAVAAIVGVAATVVIVVLAVVVAVITAHRPNYLTKQMNQRINITFWERYDSSSYINATTSNARVNIIYRKQSDTSCNCL